MDNKRRWFSHVHTRVGKEEGVGAERLKKKSKTQPDFVCYQNWKRVVVLDFGDLFCSSRKGKISPKLKPWLSTTCVIRPAWVWPLPHVGLLSSFLRPPVTHHAHTHAAFTSRNTNSEVMNVDRRLLETRAETNLPWTRGRASANFFRHSYLMIVFVRWRFLRRNRWIFSLRTSREYSPILKSLEPLEQAEGASSADNRQT